MAAPRLSSASQCVRKLRMLGMDTAIYRYHFIRSTACRHCGKGGVAEITTLR